MPISNSRPLIHLARPAKPQCVGQAFPSLTVPGGVRRETIEKGKTCGYSDALLLEKLEKEGWLKVAKLTRPSSEKVARELAEVVGRGEAEATALAVERQERLLMDDQKGKQVATLYGIETAMTLGLLFELLVNGVLPKTDYRRNVKNYASQGWIAPDVVQEFLDEGERVE
ncbi:MAG: hypothetical protein JRN39_02725 [Nitrososphaerota archaeon]|nr:hypothetical protein [Nitrososphaerota archaeon]